MPTVETTTWINAPLAQVYAIAKDNRSFPEFMEDVLSLEVTEEQGQRVVSEWVGLIKTFNMKVRWTQEDVWDDEAHTCTFRQLKGDYDQMDGTWRLTEENGGTRFDSTVNYVYQVPLLGPLVGKVVHSLVIKNLDGVLASFKAKAEAQS